MSKILTGLAFVILISFAFPALAATPRAAASAAVSGGSAPTAQPSVPVANKPKKAITVLGAVPQAAPDSVPEKIACVGRAVATREAALDAGSSVRDQAVEGALTTRASALASAYTGTTWDQVKAAATAAFAAFGTARTTAEDAWTASKQSAQAAFNLAAAACKADGSGSYPCVQSAHLAASSNQYFTAADSNSLDITGDVTVEAWVKFASLPYDRAAILSKGNNGAGDYAQNGYELELVRDGSVYDLRADTGVSGSGQFVSYASWNPVVDVWYHIAYTRIAATGVQTLYVNDMQVAQTTNASGPAVNPDAGVWIGRFNDITAINFDGDISLVRVWSTALSEAAIGQRRCSLGGSTSGLAAEWTFDSTLTDNSGNANTLTSSNSAGFIEDVPDPVLDCPA